MTGTREPEKELTPEQALALWDRVSTAYHNHPSNPSSCGVYEEFYKRRCPCETEGVALLQQEERDDGTA